MADARDLPVPDAAAQAVLALGPLYHAPDKIDREQMLAEAWRVCAPEGVLIAAAMSRYARPMVRAAHGQLADPAWHELSRQ